jgi:hypothetical protein
MYVGAIHLTIVGAMFLTHVDAIRLTQVGAIPIHVGASWPLRARARGRGEGHRPARFRRGH